MASKQTIIAALLCYLSVKSFVTALYYGDRVGQPHFNPEAHGLPKTESNDVSWSEIFAEEYKQMMDREHTAKPSYASDNENIFHGEFEVVHDWPQQKLPVGQIGGLATDSRGLLHIFHRANRIWHPNSFNQLNFYQDYNGTVMNEPTMLVVNTLDGKIVNQWGKDLFVLPHGLEIDSEDNIFVTDVALHQVFKFKNGEQTPSLVLGEVFKPAESNDDDDRFCMPTDVAVASNGDFYVSDGYCASRIMKFDKKGLLLNKFGVDDSNIPHGIALAEDLDYLCVADREGMRVLCYKAGIKDPYSIGKPVAQFTNDDFGRVYGITYGPLDGLLYGILGKTGILKSQGFSVDLRDNEAYEADVLAYWSPDDEGFRAPHALALSRDGGSIFIGEIDPNIIWKFQKDF